MAVRGYVGLWVAVIDTYIHWSPGVRMGDGVGGVRRCGCHVIIYSPDHKALFLLNVGRRTLLQLNARKLCYGYTNCFVLHVLHSY